MFQLPDRREVWVGKETEGKERNTRIGLCYWFVVLCIIRMGNVRMKIVKGRVWVHIVGSLNCAINSIWGVFGKMAMAKAMRFIPIWRMWKNSPWMNHKVMGHLGCVAYWLRWIAIWMLSYHLRGCHRDWYKPSILSLRNSILNRAYVPVLMKGVLKPY